MNSPQFPNMWYVQVQDAEKLWKQVKMIHAKTYTRKLRKTEKKSERKAQTKTKNEKK